MKHLFIIDPLARLQPAADTSIAFMREASRRGHEVHTCHIEQLGQRGDVPYAHATRTRVEPESPASSGGAWYATETTERTPVAGFDAVWMRKDPPFDMNYLYATFLLSAAKGADAAGPVMVNDPQALRDENEKLFALEFADLCPQTLVTRDMGELMAFREELGGEMVVKPLDGAGGEGIFHVQKGDRNARAILEVGTRHGRQYLMAQQFVPEVREGDKRIILIDGEPAGAVLRVPAEDDARANFHAGGQARSTRLTARDLEICARVGPRLRATGVIFAGIDVLGDYLTEINVTSPTGIREIKRLDGVALEGDVLDAVERRAAAQGGGGSEAADA